MALVMRRRGNEIRREIQYAGLEQQPLYYLQISKLQIARLNLLERWLTIMHERVICMYPTFTTQKTGFLQTVQY